MFSGIFLIDETFMIKSLAFLITDLHFWAWSVMKESTNFDMLHLQELKPETIGCNGKNKSNTLYIFGSPLNKGVYGFSKFSAK